MSKKLLNSVGAAVDECLAGLVAADPGLELLQGYTRVVVRSDIASVVAQNKVTLVSGGGSGHEPAHGGYVGRAMLSAAVAGDVFASPPPMTILAAIKAVASPAGTLLIVKNYTGDRLNFGIAAERACSEGINVGMVIVGEDTALPATGGCAGRRGLCGTVLVHKVAGAMAEQGHSLEEVEATAQRVADSIATMSVCLSPCTVPGLGSSFVLGENEIEMGLGIHGEAGAHRCELESADRVVAQMLSHLTSQKPGHQYFTTTPGMEVVLVVNNLGGTSNLEMGVLVNSAIKHITECLQLKVVRVIMGTLMTSLDMAGVSLTLMKLENDWIQYLDMPTTAPGWPCVSTIAPPPTSNRLVSSTQQQHMTPLPAVAVTTSAAALQQCVLSVCEALSNSTNELNQLDRGCGDGDCGTTITNGVNAIQQRSTTIPWDNAKESLLMMADCVETSMGGTSGAIYTLFLTAGAAMVGHTPSPVDWIRAMEAGMNAVMRYGGASVGDRTMLDALHPAVTILSSRDGQLTDIQQCLEKAVTAAEQGAASTAGMLARAGRASNVHPSQLSRPDPGARAVAIWLSAILQCVNNIVL